MKKIRKRIIEVWNTFLDFCYDHEWVLPLLVLSMLFMLILDVALLQKEKHILQHNYDSVSKMLLESKKQSDTCELKIKIIRQFLDN